MDAACIYLYTTAILRTTALPVYTSLCCIQVTYTYLNCSGDVTTTIMDSLYFNLSCTPPDI